MSESIISKQVYENLIKHLTEIEEEKDKVLEEYYYDVSSERIDFEDLINNYVISLDKYIKTAKIADTSNKDCPFVTINSIVEVEDLQDNSVEKYQIISPFIGAHSLDGEYASYLSPIGKSLLLKKQGDKVIIETPVENIEYKIKSIEFPFE